MTAPRGVCVTGGGGFDVSRSRALSKNATHSRSLRSPAVMTALWVLPPRALTGERAGGGGVDAVTAVAALAAGDFIIRLPQGRARGGGGLHLLEFPLQYSAHGLPHLHLQQTDSGGAARYLISSLGPS